MLKLKIHLFIYILHQLLPTCIKTTGQQRLLHRKEIIVNDFLVSPHSFSFYLSFAFPLSLYSSVFISILYSILTLFIYFSFSTLCPCTLFPPPPTTIHLFSCHILPSSRYLSIPSSLPWGQAALTCICLAWMNPRFGLNAPIILLNYDALLWAVLLRLCGSLMKAGTAQRNRLQRPD